MLKNRGGGEQPVTYLCIRRPFFFSEVPHAEEAGKQTSSGRTGVTPLKTASPTLRSP